MRLLFFTKGDRTVASSRQRVWLLAEKLEKEYGCRYSVLYSVAYPWWSLSPKHIRALFSVVKKLCNSNDQTIFVHKALYSWDIIFLILLFRRIFGQKLVF